MFTKTRLLIITLWFFSIFGGEPADPLKGLLLYKEEAGETAISGITIQETVLPGQHEALIAELQPFLNQPVSFQLISEIKKKIHAYFQLHDRPFLVAFVPAQTVCNGVLKIKIIEGCVGTVRVEGNCWVSESKLRNFLRIEKCDPIDMERVQTDMAWINRNPFRQAELMVEPGVAPGTTDFTLLVKDKLPLRVYAGGDNTGNLATGEARWYGGFNWGNAFGLDHILSYQFTSASVYNHLNAHTVQYVAPLSWRHIFTVYGGYTDVRGDLDDFDMHLHGNAIQASARYQIPLTTYGNFLQYVAFGYDFKRTNNGLVFGENVVSSTHADINQWALEYSLDYKGKGGKISFLFQGFGAPFQMTPHQTNHDYQTLQPLAIAKYAYGRFILSMMKIWGWGSTFALNITGQGASTNLLPSEKYGLGGYDSVRGYEERQVNVDNALVVSAEFRAPGVSFFRKCRKDQLEFLGFIDYGWGRNTHLFGGETPQSLLGIGPGLRYTINPYLFFRCDLGFQMIHAEFGPKHFAKWHLGGTVSY
jgi:hemolysin activation/secretion protein